MSTERVHACAPIFPHALMPSCLRRLGGASGPAPLEAAVDLRSYLATVPDPRARRGIRYPWTALLTAAAAAVLAGAVSLTAIGEWVADAAQRVLARPGFRPDPLTGLVRPPHATTVRLVLAAADGDALDRAIGRFLRERQAPAPDGRPSPPTARHSAAPAPPAGRPRP
ncbi:transposase family protein [Streptomyces similanensis]|uniref:H repeat-associated protein N-terminal domain-containing protein n=1 Tax=Streptomyces similanensis TaxID=1274988 RepID=A0ABP9KNQ9_9ACTN